jgi:hypothetical protein
MEPMMMVRRREVRSSDLEMYGNGFILLLSKRSGLAGRWWESSLEELWGFGG